MEGHQATLSSSALAGRGTNLSAGATMRRPVSSRGVSAMCKLLLTLGLGLRLRVVPGRVTGALSDSISRLGSPISATSSSPAHGDRVLRIGHQPHPNKPGVFGGSSFAREGWTLAPERCVI